MKVTMLILLLCLVLAVSARGGAGGRGGGGRNSGGRSSGGRSAGGRSSGGSRGGSRSIGTSRSAPSRSISRAASKSHARAPAKPAVRNPPRVQPRPAAPKPSFRAPPKLQPKPAPPRPVSPSKPISKPKAPSPPKVVPKPQPKPAPPKPVTPPKPITKPAPAKAPSPPKAPTPPKVVPKPQPKPSVAKAAVKTPVKPVVAPVNVQKAVPVKVETKPPTGSVTVNQNFASNGVKKISVDANKNVFQSKDGKHSVDVNAQATKIQSKAQGNPKTDVTVGGQYSYNTDKTSITASANGKPRQGVDLNVDASHTVLQSKNGRHSVDVTASAAKHVGGEQGTTKTDLTMGGQYKYNNDKTQVTASANTKPGQGVDLKLGAEHNVWQSANQRHSIVGNAEVSKHMGGPLGNEKAQVDFGGKYKYEGDKTQFTAGVNGSPGKGATASVEARHNLYQSVDKRTRVDVSGGVSQQIGGPSGNSRPDANIGISLTHDLP
uniref:Attacin C-terminal domain-containing protein n=1 Tax=Stomoxys calcitrans TaxID=35570 RepID=A0A1I8PTZ1_STOCA